MRLGLGVRVGVGFGHRIKISNRRATQRCNVSSFFYAKICSLLARRRSSQPVQRVYWPENVIDWLGKWRPTFVMQHARGQKLQSFRRKWPFYMDLYSMVWVSYIAIQHLFHLPKMTSDQFAGWKIVLNQRCTEMSGAQVQFLPEGL